MRWISGRPCSYGWYGSDDGRVYGKTLPTLEQQELRCTGLVNWIRKQKSVDPEKYLAVLERIPQMEQISKANLPKLTKECFSSCETVSELIKNHSAGSLIKALGLDSSMTFDKLVEWPAGCVQTMDAKDAHAFFELCGELVESEPRPRHEILNMVLTMIGGEAA